MVALLPVHGAHHLITGLSEYLTTSFSLADQATAASLGEFLQDPDHGIFRGPYVRTRLPYAPSTDWEGTLGWMPSWFHPYQHQAEAFRRLSSQVNGQDRRPEPTMVVTGTGSGKTESFLYPILDHCLRARHRGEAGIKAILLYPMNALANDQAGRLAKLIHDDDRLRNMVTAGKFTGESGANSRMREDRVIEDRDTLRATPPDILLTNYKMLDQLLLRDDNRAIWERSAATLQYLVLDEFHTYDGAQGTDVALLLRRLGLMLKRHHPTPEMFDHRPLGAVTPVATSATLGSEGDGQRVLDFARTIFGEDLPADAVVGETLLTVEQWQAEIAARFGSASSVPGTAVTVELVRAVCGDVDKKIADGEAYSDAVDATIRQHLLGLPSADLDREVAAYAAHPLFAQMIEACTIARPLVDSTDEHTSIVDTLVPAPVRREAGGQSVDFVEYLLSYASSLRAQLGDRDGWDGKILPGVDVHLWVREISRIDRAIGGDTALFRWYDDGPVGALTEHTDEWLPACYCRHCGRSGWMTSLEAGTDAPVMKSQETRDRSITQKERQRPLLDATGELAQAEATGAELASLRPIGSQSGVVWLNASTRTLSSAQPSDQDIEEATAIPVLTWTGDEAEDLAVAEACPSCGEDDAIRFLGSAVATLLSVAISNLFGMPDLDNSDKKTLVFSDAVQDAAHHAGFVQARSRTFTFRAVTRRAVESLGGMAPLPRIVATMMDEATTAREKFELLPPELSMNDGFRAYWDPSANQLERFRVADDVRNRLGIDVALEFGDRADLPRSLTLSGAVSVGVDATPAVLLQVARRAREQACGEVAFDEDDELLIAWARGIVEMIRINGGIYHPMFSAYLTNDGHPWHLNDKRIRAKGMPGFAKGSAPSFPWLPRSGWSGKVPSTEGAVNASSPKSRYARWTSRMLGINPHDAATNVAALLRQLETAEVLTGQPTNTGTMMAIAQSKVYVRIDDAPAVLECSVCRQQTGASPEVRKQLDGHACLTTDCVGTLATVAVEDNYYRRLYQVADARSVVAREHTGLLDNTERIELEESFRSSTTSQPDAPNVLVATPTLEMGIDIGDLSTVMLSSMPRTVASYVQRVGRAGRLTGNSLALALVRGRGPALPKLNDPLSVIGGAVEPPTAFLSAVDILHRQFIAAVVDSLDIAAVVGPVTNGMDVFSGDGLVDHLVQLATAGLSAEAQAFLHTLDGELSEEEAQRFTQWVAEPGEIGLVATLREAQAAWRNERGELLERKRVLLERQQALEAIQHDADEEAQEELSQITAASKAVSARLSREVENEFWIGSMERFGLLPNFTLMDDSVELKLDIRRWKGTDATFEIEPREYSRGVKHAIHEFAPGSVFYAQGIAAEIDSVAMGTSGSAIEHWRLCPECSHGELEPVETVSTSVCPACGSPGWADVGQLVPVVPLKRVSAAVDANRSAITDATDQRLTAKFNMADAINIPDNSRTGAWFLSGGFGAEFCRSVELRYTNLGRSEGAKRVFAGEEISAPLFQVCRHCGHLDKKAGENSKWDHKPWCPIRQDADEDTATIALGRVLRTQGVLLFLPPQLTTASELSIPSLKAAIKLGFKEIWGGDPTHLDIQPVRVPAERDSGVIDALLINDTIPGGTGYLNQFRDPDRVHELLEAAWVRVATCACRDDDREACPDCLLPYVEPREEAVTSRAAAELMLRSILLDDPHPADDANPLGATWDITHQAPAVDNESALEMRFRKLLRKALDDAGATITDYVDASHATWRFSFDNTGSTTWSLHPQKDFGYTQADFVLEPASSSTAPVAIYLDGFAYHGGDGPAQVAGDVDKRERLRAEGYSVWTLTWADLEEYEQGLAPEVPWYDPNVVAGVVASIDGLGQESAEILRANPQHQLISYLRNPDPQLWNALSTTAKLFVAGASPAGLSLAQEPGQRLRWVIHPNDAGMFDVERWRDYFRLANILAHSPDVVFGVDKSVDKFYPPVSPQISVDPTPVVALPGAWAEAAEQFDPDEDAEIIACFEALAHAGVEDSFDLIAEDTEELLPVLLAWSSARVALVEDTDLIATARDTGWTAFAVTTDHATLATAITDALEN